MSKELDVEEFFLPENHWNEGCELLLGKPWEDDEDYEPELDKSKGRKSQAKLETKQYKKRYLAYEDVDERIKKNKEKQRLDREDYWKALLRECEPCES